MHEMQADYWDRHTYWNIKGLDYFVLFFGLNYICFMRLC